jgi:hypothetical protein
MKNKARTRFEIHSCLFFKDWKKKLFSNDDEAAAETGNWKAKNSFDQSTSLSVQVGGIMAAKTIGLKCRATQGTL